MKLLNWTREIWPVDLSDALAYLETLPPLLEALDNAGGLLRRAAHEKTPLTAEEAGNCIQNLDGISFAIARVVGEITEKIRVTLDAECAAAKAKLAAACPPEETPEEVPHDA